MPTNRTLGAVLTAMAIFVAVSCENPEESIVDGDPVTMIAADGSTYAGLAVSVRMRDGSKAPGIWRGPSKLADMVSGGTLEFREDSLHSRVRILEPGDELQRRAERP